MRILYVSGQLNVLLGQGAKGQYGQWAIGYVRSGVLTTPVE